jgi:hypothetical protein
MFFAVGRKFLSSFYECWYLYVMPSKLLLFTETGLVQGLILTGLSSLGVGVSRPVTSDRGEQVDWPRQRHTQKKTVKSLQGRCGAIDSTRAAVYYAHPALAAP